MSPNPIPGADASSADLPFPTGPSAYAMPPGRPKIRRRPITVPDEPVEYIPRKRVHSTIDATPPPEPEAGIRDFDKIRSLRDKDVRREKHEACELIAKSKRVGAPCNYHPAFADFVYDLRLTAVPPDRIASLFGVALVTLSEWQITHPDFGAAWDQGGDAADSVVTKALYIRATGFTKINKKTIVNRKTGEVSEMEEEVYFPPSEPAIIFWLTNRRRDHWFRESKLPTSQGNENMGTLPLSLTVNFRSVDKETAKAG